MKKNNGYIAIITVLIIAAVVLSIGVTVSLLSIGEGQSALAQTQGEDSLNFVEGCMEDALLKIRANASYGGGTVSRPEGNCLVTVSINGNIYTVTATLNAKYKRTVQSVVTRTNSLVISSWKEI